MSENNFQETFQNRAFKKFAEIFDKLGYSKKYPSKLAIAVSGGCDSLSLAIILNEFCLEKNIKLFAVTVDHKMRQGSSKEALALTKILQAKKISHHILEINQQEIPKKKY